MVPRAIAHREGTTIFPMINNHPAPDADSGNAVDALDTLLQKLQDDSHAMFRAKIDGKKYSDTAQVVSELALEVVPLVREHSIAVAKLAGSDLTGYANGAWSTGMAETYLVVMSACIESLQHAVRPRASGISDLNEIQKIIEALAGGGVKVNAAGLISKDTDEPL